MYFVQLAAGWVGALFESSEVVVTRSVKIAPPNSLLFISDTHGGEPPYPVRGAQILATESCVSIACYPSIDGETSVTLGPAREVDPGIAPAFDGSLNTPNRSIVISTVDRETVLVEKVPYATTRVKAWVNKPSMPDKVIVGFE
jgi:hypothetical protein